MEKQRTFSENFDLIKSTNDYIRDGNEYSSSRVLDRKAEYSSTVLVIGYAFACYTSWDNSLHISTHFSSVEIPPL